MVISGMQIASRPGLAAGLILGLLAGSCLNGTDAPAPAAGPAVSYNRDIRPILAENCFACHGPDKSKRKGKLGLNTSEDARQPLANGDGAAVVPGDIKASLLVARIRTTDADDHMPPSKSGKQLSSQQIELLTRWIAQGAVYQPHWSYLAPAAGALPTPPVNLAGWCLDDVDRFIAVRLAAEGLHPAGDADRATLIRRVSLDLTG